MKEFLFAHETVPVEDVDKILSPSTDQMVILFDDSWVMEDIWASVGFFKSKTQARKNGHGGHIPEGYSNHWRKKKTLRVTILNKWKGM